MNSLLLLGYRKGLIEAIEALGYTAVLWDDKAVSSAIAKRFKDVWVGPFHSEVTLDDHLPAPLSHTQFDAVITVKEKAVVAAAILRERWKLPGLTLEKALRCHDKKLMKDHAKTHGIPITDYCVIQSDTYLEDLVKRWNYPIVVKPRCSSGRRGLQIISEGPARLPYDFLAEQFVDGEECSVESFMVNGEIQFSNITQYYRLMHANILPADFSPAMTKNILELNRRVIQAFDIQNGMTHIEFFQCGEQLVLGEIAARAPGGYIMSLLEQAYEVPIWQHYLRAELNDPIPPISQKSYSASWIIHPGEGTVKVFDGLDVVKQDANVIEVKTNLKVGKKVSVRVGVGEDVGHILVKANGYNDLEKSLINIEKNLKIEMSQ